MKRVDLGHKLLVAVSVLAIVSFFMLFSKGLTLKSAKPTSPIVGHEAKEFQVELLQGSERLLGREAKSVNLADLKGAPLIINFWASWCSSCAEEAHTIEEFWKEHGSQVRVFGIAVHDSAEEVLHFVKELGKTYPIGLDAEGRAALNYGVTGIPETVFIDAKGIVVHKEVGSVRRELLEEMLGKLLESST